MNFIKIKPAEGILVRDPVTLRIVPPEGITVRDTDLYWHRLLLDGDFVAVQEEAPMTEGDHNAQ